MQHESESPGAPSPSANANGDATTPSKTPTSLPKDRPCPFCKQPFTSSSLGRHLDLYIKEKNPKPPDGVHNVDEIRAMRGKITRRQPKGSGLASASSVMAGQKRKSSEDVADCPLSPSGPAGLRHTVNESASTRATESNAARPPTDESFLPLGEHHVAPGANSHESPGMQPHYVNNANAADTLLNPPLALPTSKIGWQATGVIGGLPNTIRSPPGTRARALPASLPSERPATVLPSTMQTYSTPIAGSDDTGSVATAALRDILNALQRSHSRISRPSAFDFDPLAMNYPALCLRILSPPDSLFSSTPLESAKNAAAHWPLRGAPSAAHKPKLLQAIRVRLRMHTSLCPPPELRFAQSREEVEAGILAEIDKLCDMYNSHIEAALKQWEEFSQPTRDEVWRLEILRFTSTQANAMHELEKKLEKTQDFVEELRSELAKLREENLRLKVQSHGESSSVLHRPVDGTQPSIGSVIDSALAKEVEATWAASRYHPSSGWLEGVGANKWDFDSVLSRYRTLLKTSNIPPLWPGEAWETSYGGRSQSAPNDVPAGQQTAMPALAHDACNLPDPQAIAGLSDGDAFERGGYG